jgi:hypothetical protein
MIDQLRSTMIAKAVDRGLSTRGRHSGVATVPREQPIEAVKRSSSASLKRRVGPPDSTSVGTRREGVLMVHGANLA